MHDADVLRHRLFAALGLLSLSIAVPACDDATKDEPAAKSTDKSETKADKPKNEAPTPLAAKADAGGETPTVAGETGTAKADGGGNAADPGGESGSGGAAGPGGADGSGGEAEAPKTATKKKRKNKERTGPMRGRPLLDGDTMVTATAQQHEAKPTQCEVEPEVARTLAQAWLNDAAAEHASVAAFGRTTLELMAVGAPLELVEGCSHAMLDEVAHTRLCLELAEFYAGRRCSLGAVPGLAPRAPDLVRLARDTFREGCVGETTAALIATRSAQGATDPTVRSALRTIADDEAQHAQLAWETLAWIVEQATDAQREEIACDVWAQAPREAETMGEDGPSLVAFGRLDPSGEAQVMHDAWARVVSPTLTQLLDGTPREALVNPAPVA